jgi:hypothetical protein
MDRRTFLERVVELTLSVGVSGTSSLAEVLKMSEHVEQQKTPLYSMELDEFTQWIEIISTSSTIRPNGTPYLKFSLCDGRDKYLVFMKVQQVKHIGGIYEALIEVALTADGGETRFGYHLLGSVGADEPPRLTTEEQRAKKIQKLIKKYMDSQYFSGYLF